MIKEKQVFDGICSMFNCMIGLDEKPLHWFFCFGTLKEFVCNRTFSLDYDIDVGVLFDQYNEKALTRVIEGSGYKLKQKIADDVTGKGLNLSFKPVDTDRYGKSHLDVYAWYPAKRMLYHTYDYFRGKSSNFMFKGVKKEWIIPDPQEVKHRRKPTATNIEAPNFLTPWGVYKAPAFEGMGDYWFYMPYAYGTLLDEWYNDWLYRHADKGQSRSRWMKEVKSTREL